MQKGLDNGQSIIDNQGRMNRFSTREAAKKLGIDHSTLANYLAVGKVPLPEIVKHGNRVIHIWSEEEIKQVRKLLPKIANGRKTRYQKRQSAPSNQQSAKTRKKKRTKK